MKNYTLLVILVAVLTQSCRKPMVDTTPAGTSINNSAYPTYDQINGNYRLYDSIYFNGNLNLQPLDSKYSHPVSRAVNIAIDANGIPSASFTYNKQVYHETHGLPNEYETKDAYYDIQKIQFTKDSIRINYLKRNYDNDSGSINITVKGYKI